MSEKFPSRTIVNVSAKKNVSLLQSTTKSKTDTSKKRKLGDTNNSNCDILDASEKINDILDASESIGVEDVENVNALIDEQERQILNCLPRIVHSENDGSNACQFCDKGYKSFKALNDHKRLAHPQTYFACPVIECRSSGGQKMFDCVREVVAHYIREHTEKSNGNIVCGINGCSSLLSEQKSFNKHIKNYHPDDEEFFKMAAKFYAACRSNHVYQRTARVSESRKKIEI